MKISLRFEGTKEVDGIDIDVQLSGEFNYAANGDDVLSKCSPKELILLFAHAPALRRELRKTRAHVASPRNKALNARRAQVLAESESLLASIYTGRSFDL